MCLAVIPVHQLVHQHKNSATEHGAALVKPHENPCCKQIQCFANAVHESSVIAVLNPLSETLQLPGLVQPPVKPLDTFQNKAPPVSLT